MAIPFYLEYASVTFPDYACEEASDLIEWIFALPGDAGQAYWLALCANTTLEKALENSFAWYGAFRIMYCTFLI